MKPPLRLERCELRPWRKSDRASVARHANNPRIALQLRDRFPHPYAESDAKAWLARVTPERPRGHLAIAVDGEAVGGIGLELGADVHRRSAEVGYWLGEEFWGRGIMTEVVGAFTGYAFRTFDLCRLFAGVFETNPASARVLEKAGWVLEGRLRRSVLKNGRMLDQLLYAKVLEEAGPTADVDPRTPVEPSRGAD
jgi:RimJ/RimL family protein N-acetyltransferase